jgi:hypothetical protein
LAAFAIESGELMTAMPSPSSWHRISNLKETSFFVAGPRSLTKIASRVVRSIFPEYNLPDEMFEVDSPRLNIMGSIPDRRMELHKAIQVQSIGSVMDIPICFILTSWSWEGTMNLEPQSTQRAQSVAFFFVSSVLFVVFAFLQFLNPCFLTILKLSFSIFIFKPDW